MNPDAEDERGRTRRRRTEPSAPGHGGQGFGGFVHRRARSRRPERWAGVDSSVALLSEGYLFGRNRFRRTGADLFETRLLLRPATVVYGADAARMFYDGGRFGRERAMPTSVMHLLQDEGSVQSLDGVAHRSRKSLFIELLSADDAIDAVRSIYRDEWAKAVSRWTSEIVLHDELVTILTRVGLRWVGIVPSDDTVERLSRELRAMIDDAGAVGPSNWLARARRRNAERWARDAVATERAAAERERSSARSSASRVPPPTALRRLATATGEDGRPLPLGVAAVELLNVLRPTVAVARFIVFGADALHRWPHWRRRLRAGGDPERDAELLTHEVRRCYPFFPVVGGTARRSFEWRGRSFREGDWVLLDLYATNHDERIWGDSTVFRPDRFREWDGDPFTLVPQGAGDAATGHRCPGERATVAIMVTGLLELAALDYYVPEQDLSIPLNHFPALPRSGFRLGLLPPARARATRPAHGRRPPAARPGPSVSGTGPPGV